MPFLAIWMQLMMSLGIPFFILGNVRQFPVAILRQYMTALYWITDAVTDNVFFGHVVKRTRRYIFLLRKNVWELTRPLADVNTLFARQSAPGVSFDMLFCARDGELDCELSWAQARDITCRRVPLSGTRSRADFENSLSDNERARLKEYIQDFDVKGTKKVVMLSQNPSLRGVQASEVVLSTLVRNVHILWSDCHGRWLSGRELLLAQAFPMTDETLAFTQEGRPTPMPLCSFNLGRVAQGLPPRSRVGMAKQAGNSMCTNAVGAIIRLPLHSCNAQLPQFPGPWPNARLALTIGLNAETLRVQVIMKVQDVTAPLV